MYSVAFIVNLCILNLSYLFKTLHDDWIYYRKLLFYTKNRPTKCDVTKGTIPNSLWEEFAYLHDFGLYTIYILPFYFRICFPSLTFSFHLYFQTSKNLWYFHRLLQIIGQVAYFAQASQCKFRLISKLKAYKWYYEYFLCFMQVTSPCIFTKLPNLTIEDFVQLIIVAKGIY